MPLYEYECEACGRRFELIQKFSDGPPDACPKCGQGPARRLVSSPAFQFKGTGWYITDYARKGGGAEGEGGKKAEASSSSAGSDGGSEAKSDGKKTDTPPAAASPAPAKPSAD